MNATYAVQGCRRPREVWNRVSVQRNDAVGQRNIRNLAEQAGHSMAKQLCVGDLIAMQAKPDDADAYWVGVCVDAGNNSPVVKKVKGLRSGETTKINDVEFKNNEFAIAVQWLERDAADPDGLTFGKKPSVYSPENPWDLFNSCELRSSKFDLEPRKRRTVALRKRANRDTWLEAHIMPMETHENITSNCI